MRSRRVWQCLAFFLSMAAAEAPAIAQAARCGIQGQKIQWIADYCMASLETDDEIAAGDCISKESGQEFPTDCAAKSHYKKRLCAMVISRRESPAELRDDIEGCVADDRFSGPTVRHGGVGGR